MKIVVLDGYALNPGDLSWEDLKQLGEVTIYDRTPVNQIVDRIKDAQIVLTNKTPLTKETIEKSPNLKYVGVLATGYNVVDIEACKARQIPVTNVPSYSTDSVAQLVFAYILEVCHHIGAHSQAVRDGAWTNSVDFTFWNYPLIELVGKTLGIIGFGSIGQAVARIAQAFGMNVLAYSRTEKKEFETDRLKFVSLEELFTQSDIITIHVPLTPQTKDLVNHESIKKMKDGVILINTARGGIINEQDLYEALESGKVYAAGVDVATKEPIEKTNPLLKAKNIFITPHIAWAPFEARERLMKIVYENIQGFLNGNSINVVNGVSN